MNRTFCHIIVSTVGTQSWSWEKTKSMIFANSGPESNESIYFPPFLCRYFCYRSGIFSSFLTLFLQFASSRPVSRMVVGGPRTCTNIDVFLWYLYHYTLSYSRVMNIEIWVCVLFTVERWSTRVQIRQKMMKVCSYNCTTGVLVLVLLKRKFVCTRLLQYCVVVQCTTCNSKRVSHYLVLVLVLVPEHSHTNLRSSELILPT